MNDPTCKDCGQEFDWDESNGEPPARCMRCTRKFDDYMWEERAERRLNEMREGCDL